MRGHRSKLGPQTARTDEARRRAVWICNQHIRGDFGPKICVRPARTDQQRLLGRRLAVYGRIVFFGVAIPAVLASSRKRDSKPRDCARVASL